jgi:hypothetical protein
VTGQAGWYDVRVRIYPAAASEAAESWPQFTPTPTPPGVWGKAQRKWQTFVAGRVDSEESGA